MKVQFKNGEKQGHPSCLAQQAAWAAGWMVRHRERAVAPHMTEHLVSLAHGLEILF